MIQHHPKYVRKCSHIFRSSLTRLSLFNIAEASFPEAVLTDSESSRRQFPTEIRRTLRSSSSKYRVSSENLSLMALLYRQRAQLSITPGSFGFHRIGYASTLYSSTSEIVYPSICRAQGRSNLTLMFFPMKLLQQEQRRFSQKNCPLRTRSDDRTRWGQMIGI